MSVIILRTAINGAVGTRSRIRATVTDPATRLPKDLSLYLVKLAVKESADETATYVVSPITGTASSLGLLDATIPAASMVSVPPGKYTGEFALYLSGESVDRIQFPFNVSSRVVAS